MAIDYQHPIIQDMKQSYRGARDLYENTVRLWKNHVLAKNPRKAFEEVRARLEAARQEITRYSEAMQKATDLPEEDRDYYVPFINGHLPNIEKWTEQTEAVLGKLEGKLAEK